MRSLCHPIESTYQVATKSTEKILAQIGASGMGEVYRAKDTNVV